MLPASEGWQRLHPLSPVIRAGRFGLVAAFILVQQGSAVLPAAAFAPLLLVVTAAGGVIAWWVWRATGYRIEGDVLELRTGVLFRAHRRVPLARVESIDIARPFLARFLGLAELRVEAVSQGGSEVKLSYLPESDARDLREQLARSVASHAPADEAPAPEGWVRVPDRDIVLAYVVWPVAGLTIAFAAAAVATIPFGLDAFAGVLVTGFLTLLGTVVASALRAERLHGFSVAQVPEGLRLRRGLLNELHQTVPLARVQAVRVEEPATWRLFGRARLLVDVAGYRGGDRESRQETAVLLPVATIDRIQALLVLVLPEFGFDRGLLASPPASARWRAPIRWRSYGVLWTPRYAVTRYGLFRRRTDVVPHAKAQSLRVVQGPWQRPLGLATLHLDTAGAQVRFRARHRGHQEAERLAWGSRARSG